MDSADTAVIDVEERYVSEVHVNPSTHLPKA
jgi:hypothetical protein